MADVEPLSYRERLDLCEDPKELYDYACVLISLLEDAEKLLREKKE